MVPLRRAGRQFLLAEQLGVEVQVLAPAGVALLLHELLDEAPGHVDDDGAHVDRMSCRARIEQDRDERRLVVDAAVRRIRHR